MTFCPYGGFGVIDMCYGVINGKDWLVCESISDYKRQERAFSDHVSPFQQNKSGRNEKVRLGSSPLNHSQWGLYTVSCLLD